MYIAIDYMLSMVVYLLFVIFGGWLFFVNGGSLMLIPLIISISIMVPAVCYSLKHKNKIIAYYPQVIVSLLFIVGIILTKIDPILDTDSFIWLVFSIINGFTLLWLMARSIYHIYKKLK